MTEHFPPLAEKAGMGRQRKQGCLITPEFGPRQRLAPIFIEKNIFEYTDNKEHD
jgi:epoxyqueuosine reductase QueG